MWTVFLALSAQAGTISDVLIHPSTHNIGIAAQVQGDDGSTMVTLRVRLVGALQDAHPLVKYDQSGLAASAFDLQPDTEYQVEISVDGDVQTQRMSTLSLWPAPTPSRVWFVSNSGGDGNGGDSASNAFATLQYAADQAQPGNEIRVLPGNCSGFSMFGVEATAALPNVFRADDPVNLPLVDGNNSGRVVSLEQCSHIVVDGLEVVNGGNMADGIGVRIHSSTHITVLNGDIHDNGHYNVLVSKSYQFSDGEGGYHLIQGNDIYDSDPGDCHGGSNQACANQTYYGVDMDNNPGPANRLVDNHIWRNVDNVILCGNEAEGRELSPNANVLLWTGGTFTNHDAEATGNQLERARDDNIELDGICVIGTVIGDAENPIRWHGGCDVRGRSGWRWRWLWLSDWRFRWLNLGTWRSVLISSVRTRVG